MRDNRAGLWVLRVRHGMASLAHVNVYLIERHLVTPGQDQFYESATLVQSDPHTDAALAAAEAAVKRMNVGRNPLTQGIYVVRIETTPQQNL